MEQKRKRTVLTIGDKLKICELVRNKISLRSIAAEFGVGKSTVADIMKNKDKLQAFHDKVQDMDGLKKRKIIRRADLENWTELCILVYSATM